MKRYITAFLYGDCSLDELHDIDTSLSLSGRITIISSKTVLHDKENISIESILQMDKAKIEMSEEIYIMKSCAKDTYLSLLLSGASTKKPIYYV